MEVSSGECGMCGASDGGVRGLWYAGLWLEVEDGLLWLKEW